MDRRWVYVSCVTLVQRFDQYLGPSFRPRLIIEETQMEGSEEDFEMEPVALSSPLPQKFADASIEHGGEKKPQVENRIARKIMNSLIAIREKFVTTKKLVEDRWLKKYVCAHNSDGTMTYHVWPGNNVFFFHGRLVCGPDPRGFVLTTVAIVLSSWVFTMYTKDDLPRHSGLIIAICMIFTVIVLANLFLVSAIDPGIIPRNDEDPVEEIDTDDGTRSKRIIVNGVALKLKYCRICKIFRPPRSCHCAICNNCVEKFDHHCPWVGQCIALRNYRFYLTFVTSALIFFIHIFAFSCRRIHGRMLQSGTGFLAMLKNCPETIALLLFSSAAAFFLGGLAIFHLYLIAINQTAYENFRECYAGSKSPFDKGILSNFKEVLFGPLPPSRVEFRAEVTVRENHLTRNQPHIWQAPTIFSFLFVDFLRNFRGISSVRTSNLHLFSLSRNSVDGVGTKGSDDEKPFV